MKVVILAGGKGTRLREKTESLPKGLIEIGGKPILWHIMKIYAACGFSDFVLCLGYKGKMIEDYFKQNNHENWKIKFADTGEETNTGGRIKKIASLIDTDTFMVTYGDGVADIDIRKILEFHRKHGKMATVTAVNPPSQFGIMEFDSNGVIRSFREKPSMDRWINGGFFVFQKEFLKLTGENDILEKEPLERLTTKGELVAYRHQSFWRCMDTYKDTIHLNEIWKSGTAPWKIWEKKT